MRSRRPRLCRFFIAACLLFIVLDAADLSRAAAGQEVSEVPRKEVAANLAAGRVVIAVVHDGILIGTVENAIEAGARVPTPVQMSPERVGILLGAEQWVEANSQRLFVNLDTALPGAASQGMGNAPHLAPPGAAAAPSLGAGMAGQPASLGAGAEASDIERIGQGLLDDLNRVANALHGKIDLPQDDPLAELILVDYLPGYGPEVWQADYRIEQDQQDGDYWSTRVLRPAYLQFWPPEKKQPRTLVEFAYPPENPPTPLLELMKEHDPRIQKIVASDAALQDVMIQLLDGRSTKLRASETMQFLRVALDAISPPGSVETFSMIKPEGGFSWILPPPAETQPPANQENRPPGAPSLAHPGR